MALAREDLPTLRRLLIKYIDHHDEILLLAQDSGLNPSRIDFSGSAEIVWHRVLEEADRQGPSVQASLLRDCIQRAPVLEDELRPFLSRLVGGTSEPSPFVGPWTGITALPPDSAVRQDLQPLSSEIGLVIGSTVDLSYAAFQAGLKPEDMQFKATGLDGQIVELLARTQSQGQLERLLSIISDRNPRAPLPHIRAFLASSESIRLASESRSTQEVVPRESWDICLMCDPGDEQAAIGLYDRLCTRKAKVFLEARSLKAGEGREVVEKAVRSASVLAVFISSSMQEDYFSRPDLKLAIQQFYHSPSGYRLVPIYLDKGAERLKIPYALQGRMVLRSTGNGSEAIVDKLLELLAQPIADRAPSSSLTALLERPVPVLKDLAIRFFEAAGRPVEEDRSFNRLLKVPELCWLASPDLSAEELRYFADQLKNGDRGFLLHSGQLSADITYLRDEIQRLGNPIVLLSEPLLRTGLLQGPNQCTDWLARLINQYSGAVNLFAVYAPLFEEHLLVGRQGLLEEVSQKLQAGSNVLIAGIRKTGKTSFLNVLRTRLTSQRFPTIWIACNKLTADEGRRSIPQRFFSSIISGYDRWGRECFENWPEASHEIEDIDALVTALLERREWQRQRRHQGRVVLFLEEMQALYPQSGHPAATTAFLTVATALQNLTQGGETPFLSYVMVDYNLRLQNCNTLPDGRKNPLAFSHYAVSLPLLQREAVAELVSLLTGLMGSSSGDAAFLDELFERGGGHPYVTRLLAAATWDSSPNRLLTVDGLRRSLGTGTREKHQLNAYFDDPVWVEASGKEREILTLAAWGLEEPPSSDELDCLITQCLVSRDDENQLYVPVGELGAWIRRKQPAAEELPDVRASGNDKAWYERVPLPWYDQKLQRALKLLAHAYPSLERIRHLANSAGVDLLWWRQSPAVGEAWESLLAEAARQKKLAALLDCVIRDPGAASARDDLNVLRNAQYSIDEVA